MAIAIIEYPHGISGYSTLKLELGALGSDVVAVTNLTLTEKVNDKGVYLASTTAALVGVHWAKAYEGAELRGNGYVWMTDEANLHIVVSYPNVVDRLGTMGSTGAGGSAPTVEEIDDQLSGTHGAGSWLSADVEGVNLVVSASAPELVTVDEGGSLTFHRGDNIVFRLILGSLVGRTDEKLYFTIKRDPTDDSDSESVLQVTELSGVLIIDGDEADVPGDATIEVIDESTGETEFTIKSDLSELLPVEAELWYDIQMTDADGERVTKTQGRADIEVDVTRSPAS